MKKKKEKIQFSWSHFMLASATIVFILLVAFSCGCATYCFTIGLYECAMQIIIALITGTGAFSAIGISFYEWKAKHENEAKVNNAKYDKLLNLAMRICEYLKDGVLNVQSVAVLKELISDGQTNISVNSANGTITTIEDTKYAMDNTYDVDGILEEYSSDGMG